VAPTAGPQVFTWWNAVLEDLHVLSPTMVATGRFANGAAVEHLLFNEFSAFVRGKHLLPRQILFRMQHYFAPTRCLDWTDHVEVARYFAVPAEDCASPSVFVLEPSILNSEAKPENPRPPFPVQTSEFVYPDQYTSPSTVLHKLPVAVTPDKDQDRVHGRDQRTIEGLCPFAVIKVVSERPLNERLRTELRNSVTKTPIQIFPNEAGMAATLREKYGLKFFPAAST